MSPYITTKHKYSELARANATHSESQVLFSLNITMISLAAAAIVAYLVLFNMIISRGYVLKSLDQRLTQLHDVQEKTHRDLSLLRSPESLAEAVSSMGLVEARQLSYPKPASAFAKSQ